MLLKNFVDMRDIHDLLAYAKLSCEGARHHALRRGLSHVLPLCRMRARRPRSAMPARAAARRRETLYHNSWSRRDGAEMVK